MNDVKDLMMLYALTSTHVGSGDDLNYIDLPIQREKHTDFPKIEASSLKGSIKHGLGCNKELENILGSQENGDHPSLISFSDARLLFFPIKSAKGIFAYVTCPLVIKRFIRDCKLVGITEFPPYSEWLLDSSSCATYWEDSLSFKHEKKQQVVLDEYIFQVEKKQEFVGFIDLIKEQLPQEYVSATDFSKKVVLIGDDEFAYFVKHATEVVTRIKIDSVKEGALFTQENLPPESILYSLMFFMNPKNSLASETQITSAQCVKEEFNRLLTKEIVQVGGDTTLGKGLLAHKMWKGGDVKK